MAYNTKSIAKDKDGNPISQYYNVRLDEYEPVEGVSGANKVVLYNEDGTENNKLDLNPILDNLDRLTGTVIDEESRKANEASRQAEESTRVSQEDLRKSNELSRESNEAGRQSQENNRLSEEGLRVEAESDRAIQESQRQSQESSRVDSEATRQSSESIRLDNEEIRLANELSRVSSEKARSANELDRESDEVIRGEQESNRVAAEADRVNVFGSQMDRIDAIERLVPDHVSDDITELESAIQQHIVSDTPHEFDDLKNNKKYMIGFQISENGQPQITYKEVM